MERHHSGCSDAEPCAYLPNRLAQQDYQVVTNLSSQEYDKLLQQGWRLMGQVLFRPQCKTCQECRPLRIRVSDFSPNKSQRRNYRKNSDIQLQLAPPTLCEQRLALHQAFHLEREESRNWQPVSQSTEEYLGNFVANSATTLEFSYRLEQELIAIAIVGVSENALNSIYAYSHPKFKKRGLGVYDVLCEIEIAKRLEKEFLYMGYWIKDCPSMAYKADYRPHQVLSNFDNPDWKTL